MRRGATIILTGLVLNLAAVRVPGESLLPLKTEAAAILPVGTAEVVFGSSYMHDLLFPPFTPPNAVCSQELMVIPQFGFRIAAGSWAEIQATYELLDLDERTATGDKRSNYGGGDARLFTKVRLMEERGRRPGFGIRFGTKLPNANSKNRLGTDETDFAIEALGSKDFGTVAAHVNMGIMLLGNPGAVLGAPNRSAAHQDDLFTYSMAVTSRDFAARAEGAWAVRLVGEVAGWSGSRFDNDRSAMRAGIQIKRRGFTLYTGASVGLISDSEDFGVTGGLIYTFELASLGGLLE